MQPRAIRRTRGAALALALALTLLLLQWTPCGHAAQEPESECPTQTCRHTYGFAYEFYFGESATVEDAVPAAAARFAGHTALTLQLWVRPYSVSSGVSQALVSDYTVDAETGEQYNCGLYLVPFNDTTSTPAFFAGQYDTTVKIICLSPCPPSLSISYPNYPPFHPCCGLTPFDTQSLNVSWRSTSGTT